MADNATKKSKGRATSTPLKTEVNSGVPKGTAVPAPLVAHFLLFIIVNLLTIYYI